VTEGSGPQQPITYFVAIIGVDGKVRASAHASEPSLFSGVPPWVSVAGSYAYYLDGDTKLMRLGQDGTQTQVASLPGGPSARVMAAVDPKSGRIAFGVAHSGANNTQLWLENADGSAAHILPGNGLPVAWHAGSIVIVPAAGYIQNRGEVNPYLALSIQVVNPDSGAIINMSAPCSAPSDSIRGPLSPAGIACTHFPSTGTSSITWLGWDGHESRLAAPLQPNSPTAALSPDGTRAAISNNGTTNATPDLEVTQDGALISLHVSASPVGWFDPIHLLVSRTSLQASSQGFEIIDVTNGTITPVDLDGNNGFVAPYGAFFAALPWD
jgi:hypothetical protein